MEYSAGGTSNRLWYVETKETARLLQVHSWDEVKEIVIEDNLYQQNTEYRLKREFNVIQKRLNVLPEDLVKMLVKSDINTSKLIAFVGCMSMDLLLFDFMYEVFRQKIYYQDETITDADWNIFIKDKREQSEEVAGFTDVTCAKLRQTYFKMLFEAGLLTGTVSEKKICKPYLDPDFKYLLQKNAMEKYLLVLTGER